MASILTLMCTHGLDNSQAQPLVLAMLSVPGIVLAIMRADLHGAGGAATGLDNLGRSLGVEWPAMWVEPAEVFSSAVATLLSCDKGSPLPRRVAAALGSLQEQFQQHADLVVDVVCKRLGHTAWSSPAVVGIELLGCVFARDTVFKDARARERSGIIPALSRRAADFFRCVALHLKQCPSGAATVQAEHIGTLLRAVSASLLYTYLGFGPTCCDLMAAVDAGLVPLLLPFIARPNPQGLSRAIHAALSLSIIAQHEYFLSLCDDRQQRGSSIASVPGAAAAVVGALRAARAALGSDARQTRPIRLVVHAASVISFVASAEAHAGRFGGGGAQSDRVGRSGGSMRTAGSGWLELLVRFGALPLLLRALECYARGSMEHATAAAAVVFLAYAQPAQLPPPLQQQQDHEEQRQQQQRGTEGSIYPDNADRLKQRAWKELVAAGGAGVQHMRILVTFDVRCKGDLLEAPGALAGIAALVVSAVADGDREGAETCTGLLEDLASWVVDSSSLAAAGSDEEDSQDEGGEGSVGVEGEEEEEEAPETVHNSSSSSDWYGEGDEDVGDVSSSDCEAEHVGRSIHALKQLQRYKGSCYAVVGEVGAALRVLGCSEEDSQTQGGEEQPRPQPPPQQQQQQKQQQHQQHQQAAICCMDPVQSGPTPAPATQRICAGCGKAAGADGVRLHTCRGCRRHAFCSQECYRQAWVSGGHREVCEAEQERRRQQGAE